MGGVVPAWLTLTLRIAKRLQKNGLQQNRGYFAGGVGFRFGYGGTGGKV
jgi:hypothetical protein